VEETVLEQHSRTDGLPEEIPNPSWFSELNSGQRRNRHAAKLRLRAGNPERHPEHSQEEKA
jgi:hypothetical protein